MIIIYRRVVGVFVLRFRAPLQQVLLKNGNKVVWLALGSVIDPLMFVFAIIRYSTTRLEGQPFLLLCLRSLCFGFVVKQILVLLV
jgi:hypothetical protein